MKMWLLFFLALAVFTVLFVRRERCRMEIRRMTGQEKLRGLNALTEPFGFSYLADQDMLTSCREDERRETGYEARFDRALSGGRGVMDVRPVYFEYDGRTWLIEFRKGQYGICAGGEVGVYHARGIIRRENYGTAHFDAAEDFEMPYIKSSLIKDGKTLYETGEWHWRLAGFLPGRFAPPKKLWMHTVIAFRDADMAQAFAAGLRDSGVKNSCYGVFGDCVYTDFISGVGVPLPEKLYRKWAQLRNLLCTGLFLIVTAPFCNTADRMLFLHGQIPWCFHRIFGNKKMW